MTDETIDYDPWDERDDYLAEGHENAEAEIETVVEPDTGEQPDLSQHEEEA